MQKRKNEPRKDRRVILWIGVLILLGLVIAGVLWLLTYQAPYQEPKGLPLMASYEHMCDPTYSSHSGYLTSYPTQISIHCATASASRHTSMMALTQASIAGTAQAHAMATLTAEIRED